MISLQPHSAFRLGDMQAQYVLEPGTGQMELWLVPWVMRGRQVPRRNEIPGDAVHLRGLPEPMRESLSGGRRRIEPLVPLKLAADRGPGGWCAGSTMRGSPDQQLLRFAGQQAIRSREGSVIETVLERADGVRVVHRLEWRRGEEGLRLQARLENRSKGEVTIEMLASFCLCGITPFAPDEATGRLYFHRYRSGWSDEGRFVENALEELSMERSWAGSGTRNERIGCIGSFPVNGWFPHAAVEDRGAGVTWAAQLCHNGSWQMELQRCDDTVSLSGGLADRLYGHWSKTLADGESFTTPEARLTVVAGDAEAAAHRLVAMQQAAMRLQPRVERDLPVVFNEWCTSWGNPTHSNLEKLADRLQGSGVRYLVIDAGWTGQPDGGTGGGGQSGNGDWLVDRQKFPKGLRPAADAIRARGLIPGLWFEFEVTTEGATVYDKSEHQLCLDGRPVTQGGRRFWDLRDPWVVDYLGRKVIRRLKEGRFGYLKVDYNDTIGYGCDGAESPGEGLRQHLEAVRAFFQNIRRALPELVIENCASGGHRLEPSMQALCAMGSSSDAHESVEIPIIAAQLQRQILPAQSQIWSTLRPMDDTRRLIYSLAACFLGRMALSGDVHDLDDAQWAVVRQGIDFYRRCTPIIRDGRSRLYREMGASHRHPEGWQVVVRYAKSGRQALVVIHRFGGKLPAPVRVPLEGVDWEFDGQLDEGLCKASVAENHLTIQNLPPFAAVVLRLEQG